MSITTIEATLKLTQDIFHQETHIQNALDYCIKIQYVHILEDYSLVTYFEYYKFQSPEMIPLYLFVN